MQNARAVLSILHERGKKGLPLDELYRQMFNPQLYLLAYGRLYANKGALTPGVTEETVDGMSMDKIHGIIEAMRHERYQFAPAKRVYIPKKNGKMRPLGLPTWSDKLVGEVVRLLLEAYYDAQFSDHSHGYRSRRGCHTALREVEKTWTGTTWFIEGDISDCFGSLDHKVMLAILGENIRDNRFLRLVHNMLRAGYLEDWKWEATMSGAPQGGIVSPILSNIYLHKLDVFVETVLIPEFTRGQGRARNPDYLEAANRLAKARRRGDRAQVRLLRREMQCLPSLDPMDPGFQRLRYVRYADDHILGFIGPRHEAERIKQRLARFLREELKLELSPEKTLITHARTGAARFLGYEITVQHDDRQFTNQRRSLNGTIKLRVPASVIKSKCLPYLRRGKPADRGNLTNETDYTIVATYASEFRGIVQYYLLASNVFRLHRLQWVMQTSMLRTLSRKHHAALTIMAERYKAKVDTPHGLRRCYEARISREGRNPLVARFGGIPLKRQRTAELADRRPTGAAYPHKELLARFLANQCELCTETDAVEVHHVRRLADLAAPQPPEWARIMTARRRKTLVVCRACHDQIHGRETRRSLIQ